MTEDEMEALERVADRAVAGLMEHFEVVQVFVCTHVPKGKESRSLCYRKGDGNWFARYGMVKEWIIAEEAATAAVEKEGDDA